METSLEIVDGVDWIDGVDEKTSSAFGWQNARALIQLRQEV
jgi:hypothetical protein